MSRIDRGEGHPVNRTMAVPERVGNQPVPEGFRALAEAVRDARWKPGADGRLVLRCSHRMLALLHARSYPESTLVPAAALLDAEGQPVQGGTYRQVEVEVTPSLDGGQWVLLDAGEQVATGMVDVAT